MVRLVEGDLRGEGKCVVQDSAVSHPRVDIVPTLLLVGAA
jgi:hypothetical protein